MSDDRSAFIGSLAVLAQLTGFQLSEEILFLYENKLRELGYQCLVSAIESIIVSRGARDPFPSIREISERIRPEADQDSIAIETAQRIFHAVSSHGWSNVERAKAAIGELGWSIVRSEGGWEQVCRNVTPQNQTYLKSHWTRLAKARMRGENVVHIGCQLESKTSEKLKSLIDKSVSGIPSE